MGSEMCIRDSYNRPWHSWPHLCFVPSPCFFCHLSRNACCLVHTDGDTSLGARWRGAMGEVIGAPRRTRTPPHVPFPVPLHVYNMSISFYLHPCSTVVKSTKSWSARRSPPLLPPPTPRPTIGPWPTHSVSIVQLTLVSCHGARRRSPPLLRAPRRGRPPSPHGAVAVEATAPAIRGRAGERDPRRATRPVAPATPHTVAMLPPPPWGGSRLQEPESQHQTGNTCTPHWACLMAEAPPTLARVASPRRRDPWPGGPYGHNTMTGCLTLKSTIHLWPHRAGRPTTTPKLRPPTKPELLPSRIPTAQYN